MKKILASDLDGTLVFGSKIYNFDKESILKMKKHGYLFGISTGRPYNGVKFICDNYNIEPDFYVLLNGALVINKGNSVLKHEGIPYKIVKEIYSKYKNYNFIGIDNGYESITLKGDNTYYWDFVRHGTIDELEDNKNSLISINFSNISVEEIDEICNNVNSEFGDEIIAFRNLNFIDIVPKGCSKGNGVKLILEELGMNKDNLYVIGDSYNDISMFNETNNSFTFNRVEKNLKSYANFLVDSVSECIEQYIL
ncbi:HAD-IIB family hydrolase [Candidatus Arthromitus sp. SFB-rat-Yit]|uniref:HAD-IIB family hydrolase n=1 Tax=Candidatus Arthromitus sp. SFB-rat-Yit TaxID=1041504 RepID=UPI000227A2F8|nr:HAD-IIB family hydrolase [Candidatus Arthromitus sp. SFB-rat-Yit]BAK80836.1 HAD-superfamily hydrolase [Candidatus Arthromitus sp. SFB-rat-Yit]